MKVILHGESDLELRDFHVQGFEVESKAPELHFSAIEMFITGLGLCTGSVLLAYGETLKVSTHDLSVRLRWQYDRKPLRIGRIEMDIRWPALPEDHLAAAHRAAVTCTLHRTLEHPVAIETRVTR